MLFELVADKRDMGCARALHEDDTAAVVGRRPALRLRHQGVLRDDGHADGAAARPRLPLPEAQRPALREVLRQMGVLPEEKVRARA